MSRRLYTPAALRGISPALQKDVTVFQSEMASSERLKLRPDILEAVSGELISTLPPYLIHEFLAGQSPSSIAHVMLGLGNYLFHGKSAADYIGERVVSKHVSESCIRQDGAGVCDYHPWQTFAYASLAGVESDNSLGETDLTLRTLAVNSRAISLASEKYYDIGHLLIGSSFLTPDPTTQFKLGHDNYTLAQLVNLALNVHANISRSSVCYDFHLTEGLCLAVGTVPELSHLRENVRAILDEQLKVLAFLGVYITKVFANSFGFVPCADRCDCKSRPVWLGHGLELAAVAQIAGFELTEEQHNTVAFVANSGSYLFTRGLFQDHPLTISHLRRAVTLLLEIDRAREDGRTISTIDLSAYSVNVDRSWTLVDPIFD